MVECGMGGGRMFIGLKIRTFMPAAVSLALLLVTSLWVGTLLPACTPPEMSEDAPPDSITTAGTASLQISNQIQQDPGTLTFYLYPGSSLDWSNANNAIRIDSVKFNTTKSFQVPAGNWKIAYLNRTKVVYPMIDESSGSQEWLRSDFKKNELYSLILKTDGNRTVWVPSYVTVPPIVQ